MILTRSARAVVLGFLASLALLVSGLGLAAPAQAADTYINGTKISALPSGKLDASAFLGSYDRSSCTFVAYGWVRYSDDTVYVRDDCADGIAGAVRIGWRQNGTYTSYVCANRNGAGTIAKCTINWPEGSGAVKSFAAGLASPSSNPNQWQWGSYVAIYD